MEPPILEARKLSVSFGAVQAVCRVSFTLRTGNLGLAGANGAGKTTLFDLLTGLCRPQEGQVFFHGIPLRGGLAAHTKCGMARTFQNLRLFEGLTVKEHLLAAYFACNRKGPDPETLLAGTQLEVLADACPDALPYGLKKLCELLRCVATGASLLFLDEPAAGMNTPEKQALTDLLLQLQRRFSLQYCIIEHDLSFLLALCQRLLILEKGQLLADGKPASVLADPAVRASFLGQGSRPARQTKRP